MERAAPPEIRIKNILAKAGLCVKLTSSMADPTNNPTKPPPDYIAALTWMIAIILCIGFLYYCQQLAYQTQTWEDVKAVGGMRVGRIKDTANGPLLPIMYDITGTEPAFPGTATRINKGVMIHDLTARKEGDCLVITAIGEKARLIIPRTNIHYAKLWGIPRGIYDVYYGTAGDEKKLIGKVEIP